ncbi:ABC transporter substrate-binding protein [Paenibacillus taiwanensis]|uniref:ABC transporter substrate-binding protein n=1 Tax=Paenibacillus taiwanensis TaxID=401638 RepID=UPI00041E0265|nr:ABC transporter substrate-binding protein [Paenibacillus taiwanensis]
MNSKAARTDKRSFPAQDVDAWIIRLRDVNIIHRNCEDRWTQQFTFTHILIIVLSGTGKVMIGEQEHTAKSGSVFACPPGQTFGAYVAATDTIELVTIAYEVLADGGMPREPKCVAPPHDLFPNEGELMLNASVSWTMYGTELLRWFQMGDGLERFRAHAMFQEMLYHMMKHLRNSPKDSLTALEATKLYMDNHYDQSLSMDQLARMADISAKYYAELFKKMYGMSALDYLTSVRMKRAKQLLTRAEMKLKDVAAQVGYQDEFYFSRKFKQQVGVAPTVYMKNRQRKIAVFGGISLLGYLTPLHFIPYAAPLHPKWGAYYYNTYRNDIPVHLSAYRYNEYWEDNVERLRQAKPEAILCYDNLETEHSEKLREIAPLLFVPHQLHWREQLLTIAAHLQLEEEATRWLHQYDRQASNAAAILKQRMADATCLIVRIFKDQFHIYSNEAMTEVFYGDLGIQPSCPLQSPELNEPTSISQLQALDPDYMLVLVCQENDSLAHWKEIQESPEWGKIRAVKSNRTYQITSEPWRESSPWSHESIIQHTLELFNEKCP